MRLATRLRDADRRRRLLAGYFLPINPSGLASQRRSIGILLFEKPLVSGQPSKGPAVTSSSKWSMYAGFLERLAVTRGYEISRRYLLLSPLVFLRRGEAGESEYDNPCDANMADVAIWPGNQSRGYIRKYLWRRMGQDIRVLLRCALLARTTCH